MRVRLSCYLPVFIFLFWSVKSQAQDNIPIPVVELSVKPNICIAPREAAICKSRMDVIWSSSQTGSYCLHSSAANQPLNCWQGVKSGQFKHTVIVTEDIMYWIGMQGLATKLGQTTLRYARLKPHRKYPRRGNRLPWSIQGS